MNYADYFPQCLLINNETGTKPIIAESSTINGMIDCIHQVIIEKDVFTGHDIMILTGSHDWRLLGNERRLSTAGGPITIRKGVWIATRAIILGPCEIGEYSVIGAGSVVTKDVPPYQLWAGNPAHFIKEIPH